jgi:hypothetical protein
VALAALAAWSNEGESAAAAVAAAVWRRKWRRLSGGIFFKEV